MTRGKGCADRKFHTSGPMMSYAEPQPVFSFFLHLINRQRAIHIHRRLVRLMTEKVLNPLGAEAFGFQKPGDRMTKEVRIEMCEARIGGTHKFRTDIIANVLHA